MIELKCPIHEDMVQPLEDHFCELTRSSWMLFHEGPGRPHFVMGYFDTKPAADEAWLRAIAHAESGFDATAVIKRSDFGLGAYVPAVGDDVTLSITVEATQAK